MQIDYWEIFVKVGMNLSKTYHKLINLSNHKLIETTSKFIMLLKIHKTSIIYYLDEVVEMRKSEK